MRLKRWTPDDTGLEPRELDEQGFAFSAAIVRLAMGLQGVLPNAALDHLVEEGTAIGSSIAKARFTRSRRDFLEHMTSAWRASQRVRYWLALAVAVGAVNEAISEPLHQKARFIEDRLEHVCATARQLLTDGDEE